MFKSRKEVSQKFRSLTSLEKKKIRTQNTGWEFPCGDNNQPQMPGSWGTWAGSTPRVACLCPAPRALGFTSPAVAMVRLWQVLSRERGSQRDFLHLNHSGQWEVRIGGCEVCDKLNVLSPIWCLKHEEKLGGTLVGREFLSQWAVWESTARWLNVWLRPL